MRVPGQEYYYPALFILSAACSDPAPNASHDNTPPSGLTQLYGVTETRTLFRSTNALYRSDRRIAVGDGSTGELLIIDHSGRVRARAGGIGGGPGEHLALAGILAFRGDSILSWDPMARRITVWSGNLVLGRTVRVDLVANGLDFERWLDGSRLLFRADRSGYSRSLNSWDQYVDSIAVGIYDVDSGAQEIIAVFKDKQMVVADASDQAGPSRLRSPLPDGPRLHLAVGSSLFAVLNSEDARIRRFNFRGEELVSVQVPISREPRPEEAWRAQIEQALSRARPGQRPSLRRYLERFPQPTRYPTASAVLIDDRDRIWVREYSSGAESLGVRWHRLDENGADLVVHAPTGLEVNEIAQDVMLGVYTDSMDVESLATFAVPVRSRR